MGGGLIACCRAVSCRPAIPRYSMSCVCHPAHCCCRVAAAAHPHVCLCVCVSVVFATAGFLFFKGVNAANEAAERQDRMDGYIK